MRREWDEARLREAFRALSDSEGVGEGNVDTLQVWKAVAGELSPEERFEVIDKVALEPGYAEAWRLATELFEASGGSIGPSPGRPGRKVRRAGKCARFRGRATFWPRRRYWSLAFSAFSCPRGLRRTSRSIEGGWSSRSPAPRGASRGMISGCDGRPPKGRDSTSGSRPRTFASSIPLRISLRRSTWFPRSDWKGFLAGAKVFWQVEATLPDGSVVQSGTFITEVK